MRDQAVREVSLAFAHSLLHAIFPLHIAPCYFLFHQPVTVLPVISLYLTSALTRLSSPGSFI